MPTLKYVGPSHFRKLSVADLAAEGIQVDSDIHIANDGIFRRQNPGRVPTTVEVSDEVADFLLRYEKNDWKALTEKQEEKLAETQNASDNASGAQDASKKGAKKS